MRVVRGLRGFNRPAEGSVLAIGVFDGVHIGHRKIIKKAVRDAGKLGMKSVVLTFDPHPAKILRPKDHGVPSLISLDHRIRFIEKLGADILVVMNFNRALADIAPGDFAGKVLSERLGAKEVCVGDNFYFGRRGSAGAGDLRRFGKLYGFKVNIMRSIRMGRNIVSSSLIRRLITSGRLHEASKLLGRRVSVLGTVVGGAHLARELGYPTANLNPHHEVVPPGGVYAVFVSFKRRSYKGVLNIGLRPTFYSPRDREAAIEVHIFDFKDKIYGHDLEVFFVKKIRDEAAFSGKDELVGQIKKDEISARRALMGRSINCS